MSVRITVLVENAPATDACLLPHRQAHRQAPGDVDGEHGLSLLVETEGLSACGHAQAGARVLFDTGASGLVTRNAEALGHAKALAELDAIVLSHGHYDHTGGLVAVLKRAARGTPVYVRPGFFGRKVKRGPDGFTDIGVPVARGELERLGARIVEEPGPSEIFPGLFVSGEISLEQKLDSTETHLLAEGAGGKMARDAFPEEQALALKTARGLIVLVGCAHRGLMNSVAAAQHASGEDRVRAILGGAHLRSASREMIGRTAEAVAKLDPDLVALGHCTGSTAEEAIARRSPKAFRPLRAGSTFVLD